MPNSTKLATRTLNSASLCEGLWRKRPPRMTTEEISLPSPIIKILFIGYEREVMTSRIGASAQRRFLFTSHGSRRVGRARRRLNRSRRSGKRFPFTLRRLLSSLGLQDVLTSFPVRWGPRPKREVAFVAARREIEISLVGRPARRHARRLCENYPG
ncbi:MAG: hypothetical protein Udaeo2_30500 [Candidatus Udaeobacter sp.]|nr:MAG: hypothetical protein Udaeo2_30500 [Candidatus Udaeobacter sp.]